MLAVNIRSTSCDCRLKRFHFDLHFKTKIDNNFGQEIVSGKRETDREREAFAIANKKEWKNLIELSNQSEKVKETQRFLG